jgi:hypothetical protein
MKSAALIAVSLLGAIAPAAPAAYDRYGNYYETRDYRKADALDAGAVRVIDSKPVFRDGEILGYNVRYVYGDREYVAHMTDPPGRRLQLGRDIREDGTPYIYPNGEATYTQVEPGLRESRRR